MKEGTKRRTVKKKDILEKKVSFQGFIIMQEWTAIQNLTQPNMKIIFSKKKNQITTIMKS